MSEFLEKLKAQKPTDTDLLAAITKAAEDQKTPAGFGQWQSSLAVPFEIKVIKSHQGRWNEERHWIELRDVDGNAGWLYNSVKFFAFETLDYWILVEREKLQQWIESKCMVMEWCSIHNPELYKLTSRSGKAEAIALVKTLDLAALSFAILTKEQQS